MLIIWIRVDPEEICRLQWHVATSRRFENLFLLTCRNDPPRLPLRDRGGVLMAEFFGQRGNPTELSYNAINCFHAAAFYTLSVSRQHRMCKAAPLHISCMKVAQSFRKLIERSGRSLEAIARDAGYSFASGLQRYISDDYRKAFFSRDFVDKLVPGLVGFGEPPITLEEVYELAGMAVPISGSAVPQRPLPVDASKNLGKMQQIGAKTLTAGLRDETIVFIREYDVRASSGPNGGLVDVMHGDDGDIVVGRFGFPARYFREQFGAQPDECALVEVVGDSMVPTLRPGERVLVKLSDINPTPPGIFALWDGNGQVIKRVEYIPHSEPPTVLISSDNKAYKPYKRQLGEAYIQGRVVWRGGRM